MDINTGDIIEIKRDVYVLDKDNYTDRKNLYKAVKFYDSNKYYIYISAIHMKIHIDYWKYPDFEIVGYNLLYYVDNEIIINDFLSKITLSDKDESPHDRIFEGKVNIKGNIYDIVFTRAITFSKGIRIGNIDMFINSDKRKILLLGAHANYNYDIKLFQKYGIL